MKNIYELLNEIDINEIEIEEMEVSDSETAKIKKGLKQKISKNAKANKWKRNGLIASVIFGLSYGNSGNNLSFLCRKYSHYKRYFSIF
ncbi:hypothetical protein J6TS2_16850 [Heyndrickxia sporothermodurans]|nr:hypothetical protein J6TS2_16850 [Heyndrickxia sporothermodurans]